MEPRTILSDYTYSYYSSKGYPTDILSDLDTKSGASTLNMGVWGVWWYGWVLWCVGFGGVEGVGVWGCTGVVVCGVWGCGGVGGVRGVWGCGGVGLWDSGGCGGVVGVVGVGVVSPCFRTFQGLHSVRLWTPTICRVA
jgi:hypothetical protein